jgi:hypothetical protein
MMALTKIGQFAAFALAMISALAGMVWGTVLARQPELNATAAPEARPDQPDDSLPKGAVVRLGSSRLRHGGVPYGAPAFSADGKKIASASTDAVYLFDVASGRLLQQIRLSDKFHPRVVRFVGEGKRIAVAAADWRKSATLTIYDVADGKALARSEFQSTKSQIFIIDFNADASRILVEDRFAKVFLWDVKTGSEVWSIEHPEASFTLPFYGRRQTFHPGAQPESGTEGRIVRQGRDRVPTARPAVLRFLRGCGAFPGWKARHRLS